ncbi:MAG: energy transducer TonB [Proteobacteria bacterium]|nr:energy transducer TonB [Pseudomonadota bacterium]
MESITVDFAMIEYAERSGEANIKGEGQRAKGKGEKISPKVEGAKAGSNKVRNVDNLTGNKQFAANNAIDSEDKDKSSIPTDTVSLNAFISNHNEHGSRTGAGVHKGGKIGSGVSGSSEGIDGGGVGLPGQGGEGKLYDYGYVREAVMKNLKYPEKARRFGWEGRVILYFIINETGLVRDVKIVKSSGIQMLDEAAKDALTRVAAFNNKYKRLVVVQLPIEFKLKQ